MRKRPCCMMACVFLMGILWSMTRQPIWIAAGIMIGIYGGGELLRKKRWRRWAGRNLLLAALFLLACVIYQKNEAFRENYQELLLDGEWVTIQGEIYKKEIKNEQYLYYLKDCHAVLSNEMLATNHVIAYFETDESSIGEILIIEGKLNTFSGAANEGNFDQRQYYWSQKIDYALKKCTVKSRHGKADALQEYLYQLRGRVRKIYDTYLSQEDAGVLSVMLLGDKSTLESETRQLYQVAGISHILAISGLHVSLLGTALYRRCKKLHLGYWKSAFLSGGILICYAIMTGAGVSTRRAVGMFLLSVLAEALGRTYDLLNGMGALAILLLIENPFLLEYSGFVFSFGAILGVGVAGHILSGTIRRLPKRERTFLKGRLLKMKRNLAVSLGIQLVTIPIVACYYYEVPTYAMIVNLFVLPLLPAILVSGILGAGVGLSMFSASIKNVSIPLILLPCRCLLGIYSGICVRVQQMPYAQVILGCPSAFRLGVYYLILAVGLYVIWTKNRKRKRNRLDDLDPRMLEAKGEGEREFGVPGLRELESGDSELGRMGYIRSGDRMCSWKGAVWIAGLLMLLFWPTQKEFEIDVLDVGQGDGIYLCTEDKISTFIDGGSTSVKNVGTYRILPFLKYKGIREITYWFVSHGDQDHVSGLLEVLESGYPVKYLVLSQYMPKDEAYETLCEAAGSNGTELLHLKPGDRIASEQCSLTCIYPGEEDATIFPQDRNALSQVILYRDEGYSALFTGDIPGEAEMRIGKDADYEITFYKAAHHGSNSSNTREFLETLSPKVAAVSCGLDNSYGHPGVDAVTNMEAVCEEVYYTMEQGQIVVKK